MTTAPPPVTCRLLVILAREAPVGVIFRRDGRSGLNELITWHTDTDTFERGQWYKGQIWEYGSDLSPNGSLLIYPASGLPIDQVINENWLLDWVAISRLPWLTAIAFWPLRDPAPSFFGAGLFVDDRTVWISSDTVELSSPKARKPNELVILTEPNQDSFSSTRLERDGWRVTPGCFNSPYEKADPWGTRKIVMHWHSFSLGSRVHSYALVESRGGSEVPIEAAWWADWDQKGRLVFTRDGKVFVVEFDAQGQMIPRELADFNADTFEPREAPAWAREW
jgi:hypothetical protein